MATPAIQVENISKRYGKNVLALNQVSLEVGQGELFGLIGPDGAGKTTLIRILATLLLADKGYAAVNGWEVRRDYRQIRSHIGYMPGRFSLYQDLSVEENLHFFATIFGTTIKENYELIRDIYVQLEPFRTRKAGKLSGGMKQKLALCCALIHKPVVLLLDEPTTGVDPVSRKEFWEMLKRLKEKGKAALFDTLRPVLLSGGSLTGHDSEALAASLGMKIGALRMALSRLLEDFRETLRAEIVQTTSAPDEVKEEFRHLVGVFGE